MSVPLATPLESLLLYLTGARPHSERSVSKGFEIVCSHPDHLSVHYCEVNTFSNGFDEGQNYVVKADEHGR